MDGTVTYIHTFRVIITAAVLGMLFMSLSAADEAAWGETLDKAVQTSQPFDLRSFTTVRDGLQVIHLPAGIYRMSTTLRLPSNTVLEGEGDATIIRADSSFIGSQLFTNSDHISGNRYIFIRNLRMEVNLPQLPGGEPGILRFRNVEQLVIEKLTMVIDSPMYGIDLAAQVRNATVQGCTITNVNKVSGGGIMIRNGDPLPAKATGGIVVRNNRMESVRDEAVAAFGWEGVVENVRIEKNTISAHGASFAITAYGHGHAVPSQHGQIKHVKIIENVITGSKAGAIAVMGGAEDVAVTGNQVEGTEADGIFIHPGGDELPPARDVTVSRNTIKNAGRHGIYAIGVNVQVVKNEVTNCTGSGIYAASGVSITGNVISVAHPGISVEKRSPAIIGDNVLNNADGIVFFH